MGIGLAVWLGWPLGGGLVFGLALSVASTVVLLRALQERRLVDTERGRIAVGWLIVEDLAMVLTLVLLPALAGLSEGRGRRGASAGVALPLAITLGKVGAFVALHAGDRPAGDPVAAALRGAHRLARAVPPGRAGDLARHRLRRGRPVRRVVRARRVLRRHDPERIRTQPSRRAGDAAAARRVRRAVLRLGRHAGRSDDRAARPVAAAGDRVHHRHRQVGGRLPDRARCSAIRRPPPGRSRRRSRRSANSRSSSPGLACRLRFCPSAAAISSSPARSSRSSSIR